MNEQRRKELVKVLHKLAEDGRIAVRRARTDARDKVKKSTASPKTRRSTRRRNCRRCTTSSSKIDALVKAKEAELMEV